MKIKPFKLERYFARYEFSAPYLLSCSDCEPLSLKELLEMADDDSVQMWNALKLGYTESKGHPLLREEISRLYDKIGPDDVIVLTPEEGIFIAMNVLLEKGDHVITVFPGYQSLYEIALSLGCEVSRWTPRENQGWNFDINDLGKLIRENTKLIVINFPHNPTGAVLPREDMREVIGLAEEKNIFLFSDEMYRYLEYDETLRPPSVCDLYENTLALSGMSKTFALAGLRLGWLASKNTTLLGKISSYKDYTTICSSAPSEILAIAALRMRKKIISRNLRIIFKNLGILEEFFSEYGEIVCWEKPQAGPIGFPKLKRDIRISDFCLDLVEKKGVMLLPADQYDYLGNNFRIGFARRNMPEALERIAEYIDECMM